MSKKLQAIIVVLLVLPLFINAQSTSRDIDKVLIGQLAQQQLKPSDIAAYQITSEHTSSTSGVQHIYFRQTYNGIEVIGTESSVHTKDGELIQSNLNFYRDIDKRAKKTSHVINETTAIQAVASEMNYVTGSLNQIASDAKTNTKTFKSSSLSRDLIPVKKVYTIADQGYLIATWELFINEPNSTNWYNFFVDAATGTIISKKNRTISCTIGHDHTESNDNNAFAKAEKTTVSTSPVDAAFTEGTYTVYPVPLASPFDGDRSQVSNVFNTVASPFGWHDTNGVTGAEFTVTQGNNANAYDGGDNFGFQPDGGTALVFDYPINTVYSDSDQSESAVITNLFYWNNVVHDVLYQYGFDEASGNYQVNNYGNGGLGNDQVNAEAQDSGGTCNAFFSFSPDGQPGLMEMFICGNRDGDIDNLVIVHEYGHGISTRLTGGAANPDCLFNQEQMGEGWSDWYGTILTIEPGDVGTDLRPVGNWLFGQDANGPGIRDFPYTTDLNQDPRTYNSIQNTSIPHGVGSVWAAMLWEMTWSLIEEYGFDPDIYNGTGGNNIALALVTEGLKLQPCNPGFVDGRDAILAADLTLYGGANQCRIWNAFAKRGLGLSADQGSSFNAFDGTEAFDSPATSFQLNEEPICVSADVIVLGGGLPTGGEYSGPGVTDNGDGQTFTFDPTAAGIADHTITYVADSTCDDGGDTATATITVKSDEPTIICQDITVTLDDAGNVQIIPEDVVTNFLPGEGYSIDQSGVFSPEDISGSSTLELGDDQTSSPIALGFDFTFFENTYSTATVSSNGFLTFDNTGDSGCCSGDFIPSTGSVNNFIAFAWSDLFPGGSSGTVSYATIGTAPNRVFILDFNDVSLCCDDTPEVTTQLKLFENGSQIEIHTTAITQSGTMTQGIENADGTEGYVLPERNSTQFTLANDFIAFIPNTGEFPDNCGNTTTVALDINAFTCADLGENTVTATATDSEGNTSSCTATVTVISEIAVTFEQEEQLCADQTNVTLGGGLPTGGIYSGTGVTDDGNGTTFTIDPSVSGEGTVTVSYSSDNSCGENGTATVTLEIISGIPEVACQNFSIDLNNEGTATISWEDLFDGTNFDGNLQNTIYALNPNSGVLNIAEYQYNQTSNDLVLNGGFNYSTGLDRNYGFDKHPETGQVYLVASEVAGGTRSLYSIDLNDPTEDPVLVSELLSSNGSNQIIDITFDGSGNLYGIYNTGELELINTETGASSPFTFVDFFGAGGITYDYDNDRLLYATGTGPVNIFQIDLITGNFNNIGAFFTPGPNEFCSAQALEYLGNNTLIAGGTSSCNIIYNVDLTTFETTLLANPTGSYPNIKDLLLFSRTPLDNCSDEPLTFTVSPDTFDCSNLGENTITLTATDSQGNTTSCTSTVIVATNLEVTLDTDTTFCVDQGTIILGGGLPLGGEYSGPGVTDNGNGTDFTLDPAAIGEGFFDIIYSFTNACDLQDQAMQTIEVLGAIPDLECNDITVSLDENGLVILDATLLLGSESGSGIGTLYALNPFSSAQNIAKYEYDTTTDGLVLDPSYSYSTGTDRNYGFDQNPVTGELYILGRVLETGNRALYSIDLEDEDGTPTFISNVFSVSGSNLVQDMTFGSDGTLYMVFNGGEINTYDIDTGTTEALASVVSGGAVGMTFDNDENRLLYVTGAGPINLLSIDPATGSVTELFTFFTPGNNSGCSAQGIEYVGQGKVIASSTFSCDIIYTVDLTSQETTLLANPTGSFSDIKDLMLLASLPVDNCNGEALTFTVTPSQLDCSNLGENTVTVIATDADGNTSECTSTVTVVDTIAPVLNCEALVDIALDSSGNVTITIEDLVASEVVDNCDTDVQIDISQTNFDCASYANVQLTEMLQDRSFEDQSDFWISTLESGQNDGSCALPWEILTSSQDVCCCIGEVFTTDGAYGAFTSFEGFANSRYNLTQQITIPTIVNDNEFEAQLDFDWVANFDNFGGDSKRFEVSLLDAAGNEIAEIYEDVIPSNGFTARDESVSIDLTNILIDYQGEEVTLKFSAFIPEDFFGVSKAMIDNVSLEVTATIVDVEVTATDNSGNSTTCTIQVNIQDPTNACGLSTDEFASNNLLLFPNPASSTVQVTWGSLAPENVTVYDLLGKHIFTQDISEGQRETSFDVHNLETGIYLVQLKSASNVTTKRLIVE